MSSARSSPRSAAEPRWATPRTGRAHLADQMAATARALGFRGLMGWQHGALAVVTEHVDGVPAYREATIILPRQQGKTRGVVLPYMVTRALREDGCQIAYTAQTRLDARHRLLDVFYPLIAASPLRRLADDRRGSGSEAIVFANGSMIFLVSGTQTSGHGDTTDAAVIDEGWSQRDSHVETAVKPSMVTRPGAQLLVVSCAGNEDSAYLDAKMDEGRARAECGVTDTAAYVEYSAPDDADPGSEETWYGCMPALGVTIDVATVRADYETMELAAFRRSYLCQRPAVASPGWKFFSESDWQEATR
jgi:phage terminase large subunit-like protein